MKPDVSRYLPQGRIQRANESYLHFSGTNYLGTATDLPLQALHTEGIARYGVYLSTSRASNISLDIFLQADRHVATYIGTESALVLSSGFAACQTLLKILTEQGVNIHYAPGVHPANWRNEQDDIQEDREAWTKRFIAAYKQDPLQPVALFYKPIDPLHLTSISMAWLEEIPQKNGLLLIIDDSHMLGFCGKQGGGMNTLLQQSGYDHITRIMVGSLSKGMGVPAGYIAAPQEWTQRIKRSPFYLCASMPSAAAMYMLVHGTPHYDRLRKQLHARIRYFVKKLDESGYLSYFHHLPDYPIFGCDLPQLYTYLLKVGICIAHFSYPKPESPPLTRIVLQGSHTTQHLDRLLTHLTAFLTKERA